jgi:hypothetical protein
MTDTERITNQIMTDYGFDATGAYHAPEYPHANILGEGPDVSELVGEGYALEGVRNAIILEVFTGLVIWGLWELHHPIMFLAHWMVAHAR